MYCDVLSAGITCYPPPTRQEPSLLDMAPGRKNPREEMVPGHEVKSGYKEKVAGLGI